MNLATKPKLSITFDKKVSFYIGTKNCYKNRWIPQKLIPKSKRRKLVKSIIRPSV